MPVEAEAGPAATSYVFDVGAASVAYRPPHPSALLAAAPVVKPLNLSVGTTVRGTADPFPSPQQRGPDKAGALRLYKEGWPLRQLGRSSRLESRRCPSGPAAGRRDLVRNS